MVYSIFVRFKESNQKGRLGLDHVEWRRSAVCDARKQHAQHAVRVGVTFPARYHISRADEPSLKVMLPPEYKVPSRPRARARK
jgi:hypothetical protein